MEKTNSLIFSMSIFPLQPSDYPVDPACPVAPEDGMGLILSKILSLSSLGALREKLKRFNDSTIQPLNDSTNQRINQLTAFLMRIYRKKR